jgi:hypothetical protein
MNTTTVHEVGGVAKPGGHRASTPLSWLGADKPIPDWVWRAEDMTAALAERDIPAVYVILLRQGLSQRRIAARTGQAQSEICEILAGRRVAAYDVLVRIADGLGAPRGLLGLAYQHSAPDVSRPDPSPPAPPCSDLPRPDSMPAAVVRTVTVRRCERCSVQPVVDRWSGYEVRLLRRAMRLSVREFAGHLGSATAWFPSGSPAMAGSCLGR